MCPVTISSTAYFRIIQATNFFAYSDSIQGVDSGGIGVRRQDPFLLVRLGVLLLTAFVPHIPFCGRGVAPGRHFARRWRENRGHPFKRTQLPMGTNEMGLSQLPANPDSFGIDFFLDTNATSLSCRARSTAPELNRVPAPERTLFSGPA